MIEIIPNWHPLFVHFTIALLSMATLFFLAVNIFINHSIQGQLRVLAYWNLWLGTGFAVIAAIAGWFAYNSVVHDTPSHTAMTEHRNWALVTLTVYIFISLWSVKHHKRTSDIGLNFIFIILMAFILLASTGWRGSEAVYRYGLGVMSLPKVEGEGHAHEHADGKGPSSLDVSKVKKTIGNDGYAHEDPDISNKTSSTKTYEIVIPNNDGKGSSKTHVDIINNHGTHKH